MTFRLRTSPVFALVALALGAAVSHCAAATPAQRCVADRGCPSATAAPACASAPANPLEFADAYARRAELTGSTVTVRGYVTRIGALCTRRGCLQDRCCNTCQGQLALAGEPHEMLANPQPMHFVLGDDSEAWQCHGDETAQCCRLAIDNTLVVVTGTLDDATRLGVGHRITPASVCRP